MIFKHSTIPVPDSLYRCLEKLVLPSIVDTSHPSSSSSSSRSPSDRRSAPLPLAISDLHSVCSIKALAAVITVLCVLMRDSSIRRAFLSISPMIDTAVSDLLGCIVEFQQVRSVFRERQCRANRNEMLSIFAL